MKKTILLVVLLLSSLFLFADYLRDEAGLLTEDERNRVEESLTSLEDSLGYPLFIHTSNLVEEGDDVDLYFDAYIEKELREKEDFILFTYFPSTGSYYIGSWGNASEVVGDWGLGYMVDYIYSAMAKENYAQAFLDAAYAYRIVHDVWRGVDLGLVVDHAGLLSDKDRGEVQKALLKAECEVGFPVLVLTDTSNHGKGDMAYADDYQEAMGYESSILLFVNMGERSFWETTMGDAIPVFSDNALLALEDWFVPYLSSGDYAEAFIAYAEGAAEIAWGYDASYAEDDYYYVDDFYYRGDNDAGLAYGFGTLFVISLIVGLITGGVGIGIMRRKMRGATLIDDATEYAKLDTFTLRERKDIFLYSNVSRVRIENNSSSSGGGHSVHHSSSGGSHGGRGGRF